MAEQKIAAETPFAIGLRLSALAAEELWENDAALDAFKDWLKQEHCYVYTINGFPYGAFHDVRVKEQVYLPDWTSADRLHYTCRLFNIIAEIAPRDTGGSVSTLPGSFKAFHANEHQIFANLYACAEHIELLAEEYELDLHLGLEPEPLGHFENTAESLAFFSRFHDWAKYRNLSQDLIHTRIGLNFDTCHFALEFDDPIIALNQFHKAGIRISKVHLSNALSIDPNNSESLALLKNYDEFTYLHQVITRQPDGQIDRYTDLPEFFQAIESQAYPQGSEARIHYHIPLYAQPQRPLSSTRNVAEQTIRHLISHPLTCSHVEMETYTWKVLPDDLHVPVVDQLSLEYQWALQQFSHE